MGSHDTTLLLIAGILVLIAGLFSSVDAALASFSKIRADDLVEEGRGGAKRLAEIVDDPARYLNTALFVRMLCEISAIVLVAEVIFGLFDYSWQAVAATAAIMLAVSFIVIGVAPRTLGRQHARAVALIGAPIVVLLTRVLGPVPQLLILIGNVITPGKGFSEGPFSSEAELRELVDLAEASQVIQSDERQMIHSVFELGDTLVRSVMVPRTEVVFIERNKTLRQAMSLALRSGYSRIPVIGENLDDIVGFAYLKDLTKRVFDRHEAETTERVESVMRPVHYVPDSKPVDDLLREMQAERKHIAVVIDEYGGTAGLVTIEDVLEEIVGEITDEYDSAEFSSQPLASGSFRVSSRFPINELGDLTGIAVVDDDVDTVGGLMAKHLGIVPIAGSVVELNGLRLEAEAPLGRRNRIGAVVITKEVAATAENEDGAAAHAG